MLVHLAGLVWVFVLHALPTRTRAVADSFAVELIEDSRNIRIALDGRLYLDVARHGVSSDQNPGRTRASSECWSGNP